MATSVNAGARLDRLPISSFHYRIFWLIGAGMFFDGYDLYVGTNVLPVVLQSGFSTPLLNADFVSKTFLGMTIGALVTGFLGDRYGRRFTYQVNLIIFGLASLAAACAQDMTQLNWARFAMGLGLGAEIVVGYSTLTEFVPPKSRGRWLSFMAFLVVSGLPATALLAYFIIPAVGWRPMFVIAGAGALIVWYLRKKLPESPRWLESQGRTAEAEALMAEIEKEAATAGSLPPPALAAPAPEFGVASLFQPPLLQRLIVGSWCLITINTLIFGFVQWLPQFFLAQGLTISRSFDYILVLAVASPLGCALGAFCADFIGRRTSIIGASIATVVLGVIYATFTAATPAMTILSVGFLLVLAIYVQVAILFGVYTPELFPTEVRLRGNGICNTLGRAAQIFMPFIIVWLAANYKMPGVMALMAGLTIIQILVIWIWGVEPAKRPLEELATATA
ncbi:MAG: transporter, putative metabolite:H+ symporter [Alphaproteobacteria bacterium]|jgi:putative MFS transporter|nr:transporter, putative metabolite:H+ symporter [Alphaproteobacteria bacterium]